MVAHVSVLELQKELLLLLLNRIITVNLEQIIAVVYLHITYLTHYGMEVIVLQETTVAPISTYLGSNIRQLKMI